MIGRTISHYEIAQKLGEGEVRNGHCGRETGFPRLSSASAQLPRDAHDDVLRAHGLRRHAKPGTGHARAPWCLRHRFAGRRAGGAAAHSTSPAGGSVIPGEGQAREALARRGVGATDSFAPESATARTPRRRAGSGMESAHTPC